MLCEQIPNHLAQVMSKELYMVMNNAHEVFKTEVRLMPGATYDLDLTKWDPI
jgi:hypothetical protein